jgi:hypothetical protein
MLRHYYLGILQRWFVRRLLWSQNLVAIEVPGKLNEFYSFNSVVHLDNYTSDHIKISASRLVRVIINNVPYVLSPEYFTTILMEGKSTLDIVQEIDPVLSCFLFIRAEGIANEICIDLAEPLCEKFKTLDSKKSILEDPVFAKAIKNPSLKRDDSVNNCVETIQKLLTERERLATEMIEERIKQQELVQGAVFVIPAVIGTIIATAALLSLFGSLFSGGGTPAPDYFNADVNLDDDGELSVTFEINGIDSKKIPLKTPDEVTFVIGLMLGQLDLTPSVLAEWAGIPIDFQKVTSLFNLISNGFDKLIDGLTNDFTTDKVQELINDLVTPVLPPDTDLPIPVIPPEEDDPDDDKFPKARLSCEDPFSRWFMSRLLRYSAPYIVQQIKDHIAKLPLKLMFDYLLSFDQTLEELQPIFGKFESLFSQEFLDFNELAKYLSDNSVAESLAPLFIAMNNEEVIKTFGSSTLDLNLSGIPFLSEIYSQKIADEEIAEISVKDTVALYIGFTGVSFLAVEEESGDNEENSSGFNELDGYALGNSLLVMLRACITFKSSRLKVMAVSAVLNPLNINQLISNAGIGLMADFMVRMFGSVLNYSILAAKGQPVMILKFFYVYYTILSGFIALCWSIMYSSDPGVGPGDAAGFRNFAGKTRKMTGIAGIMNVLQTIEWLASGPKKTSPYASTTFTIAFQLMAWKKPTVPIIKKRGYLLALAGTALFAESLYIPYVRENN